MKHKHIKYINVWANNIESKVYWRRETLGWAQITNPCWYDHYEYRVIFPEHKYLWEAYLNKTLQFNLQSKECPNWQYWHELGLSAPDFAHMEEKSIKLLRICDLVLVSCEGHVFEVSRDKLQSIGVDI